MSGLTEELIILSLIPVEGVECMISNKTFIDIAAMYFVPMELGIHMSVIQVVYVQWT